MLACTPNRRLTKLSRSAVLQRATARSDAAAKSSSNAMMNDTISVSIRSFLSLLLCCCCRWRCYPPSANLLVSPLDCLDDLLFGHAGFQFDVFVGCDLFQ